MSLAYLTLITGVIASTAFALHLYYKNLLAKYTAVFFGAIFVILMLYFTFIIALLYFHFGGMPLTFYILISGIITLVAFLFYLFTKNSLVKRIAGILGITFMIATICLFAFIFFHLGEEENLLESF